MRLLLLLFTGFMAVTALSCGFLLLYQPDGSLLDLPADLQPYLPFHSYILPGLVLTVVVGGSNLLALIFTGTHNGSAYRLTLLSALLVIAWVVVQMLFFQFYHWLQVLFLLIGFLMVLLSFQLMGKAAV